ncbi:MAG: hypothetical protein ACM3H7_06795 [Acidobacteriaceae bacterium]
MGKSRRYFSILIGTSLFLGALIGPTGAAEAALTNRKLSGELTLSGDVHAFEISPDGHFVVFLADARFNGVDELFGVPANGGDRTRLSHDLPAGVRVEGFVITPDSQSVVYWTGDVDDYCTGIYSVPIAGGTSTNISGTVPANKLMNVMAVTSDSQYAVYTLHHSEFMVDSFEVLWAAPLDGSGAIALTSETCIQCSVKFKLSPIGNEVVYKIIPPHGPLYISKVNMLGVSEQLAGPYGASGDFAITLDGDWVVFTAMTDVYPRSDLFSVPFTGGIPIKLNGTMADDRAVVDFELAPNSQAVVYRADQVVDEQVELFSVPVDGSTERLRLLSAIIPAGDVERYQITPNSLGVVYLADQLIDERFDLGAVSIAGGINYWLNKEMVPGGDVADFAITPNSLGVVFTADKLIDETYELFSVSVIGTGLGRLNADLPAGGDVLDFEIAPNSLGVAYRADQDLNDAFALYAVPTVGGTPPLKLNTPLVPGGDVNTYAITPDSRGVVYLADQDTDGMDELFGAYNYPTVYLPLAMR